jgi:hypothetical protein
VQRVPIRPKPFDVLRYLVEHPSRLVTQEELLGAVWPKVWVNQEVVEKYTSGSSRFSGTVTTNRSSSRSFRGAGTSSSTRSHRTFQMGREFQVAVFECSHWAADAAGSWLQSARRPANVKFQVRIQSVGTDPDATAQGPCASRILSGTADARLIAVDAKTGLPQSRR